MNTWRILLGDVRDRLAELPAGLVRTCVTSPPYWGLRDYGVSGQLGLESTPEAYCAAMVDVFAEVRRVLADDGTVWLNLGDSYCNAGSSRNGEGLDGKQRGGAKGDELGYAKRDPRTALRGYGIKHKDLVGIPWMVAFALRADGWYLRSDIIWSKPNPMPESVKDRPTKAHEYIFLLSKSADYFYDAEAIREENSADMLRRAEAGHTRGANGKLDGSRQDVGSLRGADAMAITADGRNKRSVWHVATSPYPDAHFATYPEKLIEPCILAGSAHGDTVLDPFTGSGTTGAVAIRHQRNFVGCELNPAYIELARKRIGGVAPMFAQEVA